MGIWGRPKALLGLADAINTREQCWQFLLLRQDCIDICKSACSYVANIKTHPADPNP